jgi:mannose-6-phosphate isomerase-like protein (cupin superfamily)
MREERLVFGGIPIVIRVSAEDSGGAMTVLEEVEPMSDTPLHVHSREDELFYVVEGEHIFQRGHEQFRLGPGESIFCLRRTPHSQRRVEPRVGHELVVLTPGGFEQFSVTSPRPSAPARSAPTLMRRPPRRRASPGSESRAQPSAGGMLWLRRKRLSRS